MATLTITVRNTLRVYGVEPHNKWGSLVWGSSTWAQQDVQWTDYKHIAESMSLATTQSFKVRHLVSEGMTVGSTISRQFPAWVYENISVSSRVVSVYKVDHGWYVKRGETTNALEFPTDNFTEVADPATAWTTVSTPSTTWAQL